MNNGEQKNWLQIEIHQWHFFLAAGNKKYYLPGVNKSNGAIRSWTEPIYTRKNLHHHHHCIFSGFPGVAEQARRTKKTACAAEKPSTCVCVSAWRDNPAYQNVKPAPLPPCRKLFFFLVITTCWPCMAAIWAALGAIPGGGGGIVADPAPFPNRAPASYIAPCG